MGYQGPLQESFLDTLRLFINQNMWDFMYLDNDGEWITVAILNGTIDVAHDGSYQPEVTKNVCSTAVWFDAELPRQKYVPPLLRSHCMPQATGQRYWVPLPLNSY